MLSQVAVLNSLHCSETCFGCHNMAMRYHQNLSIFFHLALSGVTRTKVNRQVQPHVSTKTCTRNSELLRESYTGKPSQTTSQPPQTHNQAPTHNITSLTPTSHAPQWLILSGRNPPRTHRPSGIEHAHKHDATKLHGTNNTHTDAGKHNRTRPSPGGSQACPRQRRPHIADHTVRGGVNVLMDFSIDVIIHT